MVQRRTQLVWTLAACAAVFAQFTPRAFCRACDQPCCSRPANGHIPSAADAAVEPAGGCPLCAAEPGQWLPDTERPCRCQLRARQHEPLAPSRSTLPAVADGAVSIGPSVPAIPPQVLGVSREYLAASLSIPIRPTRILLGVWRN